MKKIVTPAGFDVFEGLPEGYRLATINDFHTDGIKKIGVEFLIKWVEHDYYQLCVVSNRLQAGWLKQFIDQGRVFIKKEAA